MCRLVPIIVMLLLIGCTAPPSPTPTPLPTATPTPPPTPTPLPTPSPTPQAVPAGRAIPAAIQQTAQLSTYRMQLTLRGSGLVGGFNLGTTVTDLLTLDGQFVGTDAAFTLRGFLAAFLGADMTHGLQAMTVNGVSYVRGPLAFLGVTDDNWYRLSAEQSVLATPPAQVNTTLLAVSQAGADFSRFTIGATDTRDSTRCQEYRGDREATTALVASLNAVGLPTRLPASTITDAQAQIWVCEDGYLRQLTINLAGTATDPQGQNLPFSFALDVQVSDINGEMRITPPPNARELLPSSRVTPRP